MEQQQKLVSSIIVTEDQTAERIGSGDLQVWATPSMIAAMENAAMRCAAPMLNQSDTSVGGYIAAKHLRPSSIGAEITIEAELVKAEGRQLSFQIKAFDKGNLVGEAEHIRFVVNKEKFMSKL